MNPHCLVTSMALQHRHGGELNASEISTDARDRAIVPLCHSSYHAYATFMPNGCLEHEAACAYQERKNQVQKKGCMS